MSATDIRPLTPSARRGLLAAYGGTAAPLTKRMCWSKSNGQKGAEHFNPDRFELLIGMLFGLANDGLVDKKGRSFPLQAAAIAREFPDVILFTKPPPAFQRVALGILGPLGHLLGYRAIIPGYCKPHTRVTPAPEVLAAAGLAAK